MHILGTASADTGLTTIVPRGSAPAPLTPHPTVRPRRGPSRTVHTTARPAVVPAVR